MAPSPNIPDPETALAYVGMCLFEGVNLNEGRGTDTPFKIIGAPWLDPEKVNPNGGAIALGHPLGCTGAKLTATILRELKRRNGRYGMVTMCVGGGMGAAGIFENLS